MKGTALAADHSDKDCRQIKDARRDATGPKVVKEGTAIRTCGSRSMKSA
jgi:hypothetical protein